MESEDAIETTLKLQECLQKFIDRVQDLRNEDDPSGDGFTREYRDIRELGIRDKEENKYPAEAGRRLFNIKKNRYKDILPYDDCRVTLDEIEDEEGSDYINASFIQDQFGYNCYIASQGPVPNTVYDFWRMIIQYKVKVIAMACRLVEMGRKKCEQYWPETVNETVQFRDISITMTSEEELTENCMIRNLTATCAGGSPQTVTQFHYIGWPDHGIPNDFDVILEMMAEMRDIKSQDQNKAPMVIHCSAGCGRTGTICAIDYSWDVLKTGNMDDSYDLNGLVKTMREQRPSMIQTPEQYMMAHVTVQTLFQKHLDLMEDHTYGNVDFTIQDDGNSGAALYSITDGGAHGGTPNTSRKNSCLQADIENTLKIITTGSPMKNISEDLSKLQTPLVPTPVVVTQTKPVTQGSSGISRPGLPRKPSTDSPPKPQLTAKPSVDNDDAIQKPKTRVGGGSFKVVSISNIPPTSENVEMRYHGAVQKQESVDKKLSYVSTADGKQDLKLKKAMFEGGVVTDANKEPAKPKPNFSAKPSVDMNSNSVIPGKLPKKNDTTATMSSTTTPAAGMQRQVSTQADKKFVTVLSVGGSTTQPGISRTASTPNKSVSQTQGSAISKVKTMPTKATNPFKDQPQSSVPPDTPPKSADNVYSVAGQSHEYSVLSNYSQVDPAKPQIMKTQNYSYTTPPGETAQPPTPKLQVLPNNPAGNGASAYSDLSNYSSMNGSVAKTTPGTVYSYGHTNVVNEQREATGTPAVGSDDMYAFVDKTGHGTPYRKVTSDALYESVSVTNGSQGPPPIPDRNYHEDDQLEQGPASQGPSDSTLGKRSKINNAFKTFGKVITGITGNAGSGNSDGTVTTSVPGYKVKLERRPRGQKQPPTFWKIRN